MGDFESSIGFKTVLDSRYVSVDSKELLSNLSDKDIDAVRCAISGATSSNAKTKPIRQMLTDLCTNLRKDPPANMSVFTEFISIFLEMSPATPTRDILYQTLNWATTAPAPTASAADAVPPVSAAVASVASGAPGAPAAVVSVESVMPAGM